MQDQEDHQHVVVGCKDQMQMIIKGKRTKRQRLPSPLRLTMSTTTTSNSSATTTTTSIDHELRNSTTEEEEDMANCLILLAQGNHHHTQKKFASSKLQLVDLNNNNNNKERLYLYECKTCNRCFSSFQALGGHRASHKKLKANNAAASCAPDQKEAIITTFVNDHHGFEHPTNTNTNTNLTLQLSSRGLYGSSTVTPTTTKSKVHECSICGAEFQSGQALGGHMRRHRISVSNSAAISMSDIGANNQEAKKARNNVLKLDLNLPAPEDDNSRESKFPFQSKEKVIVFSATSLVDCHY